MIIGLHNIRAFVLTLQEMPDKEKFIQSHFKSVGVEVENFNCISAAVSGVETKWTYDYDNPGTNYRIGSKPTCNFLSCYMLWTAMSYMNEHFFMQLEWDTRFAPDWRPRTERALKDVPADFDVLAIGNCCCEGKPMKHIAGDVYEMNQFQCGHALIIAKKALPVMLRTQRKVYAPTDVSLAFHTWPLLKTYVVLPRIADQFDTHIPK